MYLAIRKTLVGLPVLAVAAALLFTAAPASAQVPGAFLADHQYTYLLLEPQSGIFTVRLKDQFIETDHDVVFMDRFSLPVDKNGEGILNPEWHYTWWRLNDNLDNPFPTVIVRNQFGEHSLDVGKAAYLLAPALKNQKPGRVPGETRVQAQPDGFSADHYKCYDAFGVALERDVALSHQFGTLTTQVLEPRYLCNPATKWHAGVEWPATRPEEHLVCYQVVPVTLGLAVAVNATDQFVDRQIILQTADLLCVPSEKEIPTQVSEQSWGKVKAIYR